MITVVMTTKPNIFQTIRAVLIAAVQKAKQLVKEVIVVSKEFYQQAR